ncbi:MAG TPA: T9SS type A sorting domain-containing protein [Chitinophagales bacterium]|nr:T9SS type A sorting domain-containing protein [Chitinophagales bacterium]
MLKKIAILLFVLLIVQMVLYARLYANELVQKAESITRTIAGIQDEPGKDQDVNAYLKSIGIETKVNEAMLDEKYHGTKLITDPLNGNTTIRFYNPNSNNYRLEIYDVTKGLVASFVNISSDNILIDKSVFDSGSYIYKLTGENNIFCGTFVMR